MQGFSPVGDEVFWNVASDQVLAICYYDDDEDGLMLVATEDYFIRASHREKLVFEVEEVIHLLF